MENLAAGSDVGRELHDHLHELLLVLVVPVEVAAANDLHIDHTTAIRLPVVKQAGHVGHPVLAIRLMVVQGMLANIEVKLRN